MNQHFRFWPCFCAVLMFCGLPQAALAEAYGFKGVLLGSHASQIASNPKFACHGVKTPTADRICALGKDDSETIAGVPVRSLFYFYDQATLTGITVSLEEKHFQAVIGALTQKYGVPTKDTESIKTLNGESHQNVIHRWHQPGQSIVAQRYAGRIDQSSVRISDDTAAERIRQRREAIARDPKLDL